ncbi:GNAT family N-acetyltransferase [Methylomagnum sp.]
MSWQIIPVADGLGEWREAWDGLNQRLYGGHPFRDSRLVEALLRCFGTRREHLCVHTSPAGVDAIILLYPRRPGFPAIWTQFVPASLQSAPVLIERPELLDSLFKALPSWAVIVELLCQDPRFTLAPLFSRQMKRVRRERHALTMNIDLAGSFESYWDGRSNNLQKNIRRYQRRVSKTFGQPELRVLTAPEQMREAVARYGMLESTGWKGAAGTAVHINNIQGRFYSEVMARFAETGQAEVVEYWLGGRIAASRLIVYGANIYIVLKTAYDESLSEFAPGILLLHDFVERAFTEKHGKAIEFYTNATQNQLAWATGTRRIKHVMVFRNPALACLYDVYRDISQKWRS